jgi:hypothetical protein
LTLGDVAAELTDLLETQILLESDQPVQEHAQDLQGLQEPQLQLEQPSQPQLAAHSLLPSQGRI